MMAIAGTIKCIVMTLCCMMACVVCFDLKESGSAVAKAIRGSLLSLAPPVGWSSNGKPCSSLL